MNRFALLLIFLIVLFSACSSDDIAITETIGVIRDTGEVAADGCGWVIEINGTQYSPTYLSAQYREDGLEVYVSLEFLQSTFQCGLLGTGLNEVRIEQISPVN